MLIKAQVIHLRLVPKSFVVWQLGGARDCWTVQVTIMRSNDWNALLPEVPPAGEEPPPPDGNPHPQFGPDLTAEQLYQQQVHNWLVQNAAPPNGAPAAPAQNVAGWGAWPAAPVPPAPPVVMPTHLMNFQAWLAAQGLTFEAGIPPENNIVDNAADAWNDSVTISDDTSSVNSAMALLNVENHTSARVDQTNINEMLTVTVDVHSQGMSFGLSTQLKVIIL